MTKIILNITHADKRRQRIALSKIEYAIKAASDVVGDNPKIVDAIASIKDGTQLTCKGATMSELFPFADAFAPAKPVSGPLTPKVIFDAAAAARALDEQSAREDAEMGKKMRAGILREERRHEIAMDKISIHKDPAAPKAPKAPKASALDAALVHAAVGVAFAQLRKDKVVAGFACGKAKDAADVALNSMIEFAHSKHNVGVCIEVTADKREAAEGCKVLRIATTSECPLDGLVKVVSAAMIAAGLTVESTADAPNHALMAVSLRGAA